MKIGPGYIIIVTIIIVGLVSHWFDKDVQGRRKYGAAQWEAMKTEEQQQQEEAERSRPHRRGN
jgi:hypothetical protein